MTLQQRRESPGRTRFLLALTLSTVTALGVAAPLAIQAMRADEVKVAVPTDDPPLSDQPDDSPDNDRSLTEADGDSKGGIGTRAPTKARAQTSKSETIEDDSSTVTEPTVPDGALTNPSTPDTTVAEIDPAGPGTEDTLAASTTTSTTTAPTTTTTEAEPATTTTETDPDSTTSVSSTSTTTTEDTSSSADDEPQP